MPRLIGKVFYHHITLSAQCTYRLADLSSHPHQACTPLQEGSLEDIRNICAACTASPLLLQLCSRTLQHGLLTPSELASGLQSTSDDSRQLNW